MRFQNMDVGIKFNFRKNNRHKNIKLMHNKNDKLNFNINLILVIKKFYYLRWKFYRLGWSLEKTVDVILLNFYYFC